MDRRSWLFIAIFALFFLGVNWFFEKQHAGRVQEWQKKRQTYLLQQIAQIEETLQRETVPIQQLPLVNLAADASDQEEIGFALAEDAYLFTLNVLGSPKTVYVKGVAFEQVNTPNLPLLLFRSRPDVDVPLVSLPSSGKITLQLVKWPIDPLQRPTVSIAQYEDGQIRVLSQRLKELQWEQEGKTGLPPLAQEDRLALAFVETSEGYRSVGLYDQAQNVLREWSEIPALASLLETPVAGKGKITAKQEEEQFFVLENGFVQLVFSNYGGSLAEINLPFQSEKNPKSVVKKIEADRDILALAPRNARFPLQSYFTSGSPEPVFHAEGVEGGYYPLLRRDLFMPDSGKKIRVTPDYYAANITSDYPEVAQMAYTVETFEPNRIVFSSEQPYRRIKKSFHLPDNPEGVPYLFEVEIEMEGDRRGLWITSGVPEVELISGSPAPSLKYRITRKEKSEVIKIDPPKESISVSSVSVDWLSSANGFFGVIMNPVGAADTGFRVNRVSGELVPSRLTLLGAKQKASNLPGYLSLLPYPIKEAKVKYRFFTGPYDSRILREVDTALTDPQTGISPDFSAAQTYHGWFAFISQPFARFLFLLMNLFHTWTASWGLSIILLTVALRIMLYPLNSWSSRSMMKMQLIAPEIKAIQERYKSDPKKGQLETMALYREAKINPLMGCFPFLIQMPFLIGMFDLLKSSFALRGASFIPGWIDNLAAPDVLFTWTTPIPFFGTSFHLLPFVLGGVFFLQSRAFSNLPKDPTQLTDTQKQQKMMGNMSAILFTVIFYSFPSGLNIYFISSNLLGILQQWWVSRQLKKNPLVFRGSEHKEKKGKTPAKRR